MPLAPGQRFALRRYPHTHGTVICHAESTDGSVYYFIVLDDRPGQKTTRHSRDILPLGPLEELATLGKTLKNPKNPAPRAFAVGDRVNVSRVPGQQDYGVVIETAPSPAGTWSRVRTDAGYTSWHLDRNVTGVTPLEELAALGKTLKNPRERFEKGDRVVRRVPDRYRKNYVGTVTDQDGHWVWVVWDGTRPGDHHDQTFESMLRKVTPLEELALVGNKLYKNPVGKLPAKGPNLQNIPRNTSQKTFSVGDRVRCLDYAPDSFGTVRGFSKSMGDWVGVEFDLRPLRPGDEPELMHASVLEHVSPLEELAALGKTKKNPESQTPICSYAEYTEGDCVRIHYPQEGVKPRIGTVTTQPPSWWGAYVVHFLDGKEPKTTNVSWHFMEKLTPIEELALLGKTKKNPLCSYAEYTRGEMVRIRHSSTSVKPRNAVVTAIYPNSYDVRFLDGKEPKTTAVSWAYMEKLTPIEALALCGKVKKNPATKGAQFAVGDRVVFRNMPEARGTVTARQKRNSYWAYAVKWKEEGETYFYHENEILPLSPLEALAERGAHPRRSEKP